MNKVVVLMSGGVDSSTALYYAHRNISRDVVPLSLVYPSKHNEQEMAAAKEIIHSLGEDIAKQYLIIELDFFRLWNSALIQGDAEIPKGEYAKDNAEKTVVPFRNGIFISIAAGLAESIGADRVVIGAHAGDHFIYKDCRPEFIDAMARSVALATDNIKLVAPFLNMTKAGIIKMGDSIGVPYRHTYSCYSGGTLHCGLCSTCIERKESFQEANVFDPTVYKE